MQCKMCQEEIPKAAEGDICLKCREKLEGVTLGSNYLPMEARPVTLPKEEPPSEMEEAPQSHGTEKWRSEPGGEYETIWPLSVARHPSGDLLVLDEPDDYRVLRFDIQGRCKGAVFEIPNDDSDGAVDDPQGICVDTEGRIYVPDAGNDRIAIWSADGTFSHYLGKTGDAPGQFAHPRDVDVDPDGFIYVADSYNHRVQKVSPEGLVSLEVRELGRWGSLESPVAITTNRAGNILVADDRRNLVVILSPDGEPLQRLPASDGDQLFDEPSDIRVGGGDSFCVADRNNLRIRRFNAKGELTGLVDLSRDDGDVLEGGDIALLGDAVVIPDRLNDRLVCMEFEDLP